jgi:aspartyl/glutamyl-tRNA(Asn/Gln) amidotransferase C subunit
MKNLDRQDLCHLKKLSRIDCSEEEEADILKSLSRILEAVAQLSEIHTEEVKTCRYVLQNMLEKEERADEIQDVLLREQFLSNVPDQIEGLVRIPPIVKGNG